MGIRKDICDILKKFYDTYTIDIKKGVAQKPYLVVKFAEESKSTANSLGSFIYFDILVYVPSNSISPIDDIVDKLKNALDDVAEFTGRVTEDYYDETVKAYMRSIEFKVSIAH